MITKAFITISLLIGTCNAVFSQNINLIIQINERLVTTGISNIYIVFDSIESKKHYQINYVPGDLIMGNEVWNRINSDSSRKIFLKFDYNTYKKNNHEIANFSVELTRWKLRQSYMILNIYDFREKKFKRWYQWHTKNDFLAELRTTNSGLYIRQK